ncbi:CHAD domain-containing protein [Paenarthrobacter sp. NPDC090520]|uniref:CHAD domain-containing protein n=1 Tax=Paenarthrobacter sp. NPDC090520 TaxID=3364382 RepID=UPI003828C5E3
MDSEVRDSLDAYLALQLAELDGCLPLIAAADQEALHEARLALRRLRSVLSCYGVHLPRVPESTRKDIRWLARSLGEARDDYVLSQRMTLWLDAPVAWVSADALRAAVSGLVGSSNSIARRIAADPRAKETLDAAARAIFTGPTQQDKSSAPHFDAAVALLQVAWETAQGSLRWASAAGTRRNEQLHQARKDIKGLRYAVEAIAGAVGSEASTIIQAAMTLQRALGEQHDSVASLAWLSGLAGQPGLDPADIHELRSMEQRRLDQAETTVREALRTSPIPEPRRVLRAGIAPGTLASDRPSDQSHSAL